MNEIPYSNRELDMKLESLSKLMREIGEGLSEGITRVELSFNDSNRRVSILEISEENRRGANRIITWIAIPLIMLFIGYLSWLGLEIISIKSTLQTVTPVEAIAIQDAVAKAILPYSKL